MVCHQEKVLHVDMGFFQNAMLGKKSHVDMGKSHVNMGKSQHACSCPQQLDAPHVAPQMTPMPLAWVQREKEWRIMFATIHVFS
jgi:hypothetical protein